MVWQLFVSNQPSRCRKPALCARDRRSPKRSCGHAIQNELADLDVILAESDVIKGSDGLETKRVESAPANCSSRAI